MFNVLLAVLLFGLGCSQPVIVYVCKKEDPWNSILSGAAAACWSAGGILSVRRGFHAVVRSSVQCAVLVALVSGTGFMSQHLIGISYLYSLCF
jgi:hypothetical protein